ncbi:lag1 and cln8 lipid-sensing domain protein [Cystoisospora suis]|uniref:Lag1 and cln8 lipid-sensing domain protein n=1 Tax=Cystoisospora suis TaxID=483139 RepID=A0A2C6KL34_9APIC|nr:lag1 and cln8 lipid-sensing domain protein [Cystoisospora suis]
MEPGITFSFEGPPAGRAPRTADSVPASGSCSPQSSCGGVSSLPHGLPLSRSSVLPSMSYDMLSSPLVYLSCISSFFLAHALLACLLRLSRDCSPLLCRSVFPKHGVNRLISSLHASIAVNWALAVLLEDHSGSGTATNNQPSLPQRTSPLGPHSTGGSVCLFHFGRPVTNHERPLLLFSFSYFLYDTLYELISWDIPSVLHHVTTVIGLLSVLLQDCAGTDLVAALLVAEISTPALHLRYFLVQYTKRREALTGKIQSQSEADGRSKDAGTRSDQEGQPRQEGKGNATALKATGEEDGTPQDSAFSTAASSPVSQSLPPFSLPTTGYQKAHSVKNVDGVRLKGDSQADISSETAAAARALSQYDFRGPLDVVEKAFFVVFLFGRGVAAPCLVYACAACRSTPVLVRIGSVGILLVSFFWMILLFNGLMKRLGAAGKGSTKSVRATQRGKTQYSVCSPEQPADVDRKGCHREGDNATHRVASAGEKTHRSD